MRGLKTDRTASVIIRGHAFVQNLRRGHYGLGVDARVVTFVSPRHSMNWPTRSDFHRFDHVSPRPAIEQRNGAVAGGFTGVSCVVVMWAPTWCEC